MKINGLFFNYLTGYFFFPALCRRMAGESFRDGPGISGSAETERLSAGGLQQQPGGNREPLCGV